MENSNSRECDGYRCGGFIGTMGCMGNWFMEWADIVLQSLEEKYEELLEGWSENDSKEWGGIWVVSVLGRKGYVEDWLEFVLGLVLIVGFCRVVFLCSWWIFFVAAFFYFFISRVVSDVVGAVLEWLLSLLLLFLVEIELGYFMILLFVLFKSK